MARAVRRLLCFLTCMRMRTRRCLPIIAQPGDKAMAVVQYVHKRNSLADVDETGDSQASATWLPRHFACTRVAPFHEPLCSYIYSSI